MNNNQAQVGENLLEIKKHGTHEFPFSIYKILFNDKIINFISCHWHPELEIAYIKRGKVSYSVNEVNYTLDENSTMLVNGNSLHSATMIDDAEWYAILFNPKLIFGYDESIIKTKYFDTLKINNIISKNPEIYELCGKLVDLYYGNDSLKELLIQSTLAKIYALFISLVERNEIIEKASQTSSLRLKLILDYIYQNYSKKITIDDISKTIGICRSEICKIFKSQLNTTIADYILKFRLEKSIPLLLSNKLNITEISSLVGFKSSSYYAETFKKYLGHTPLDYKRNNM